MSEDIYVEQVEWDDSECTYGWNGKSEKCEVSPIISIGWVVDESDTAITMAAHVDLKNENYHSAMTIPKCAIVRRVLMDKRRSKKAMVKRGKYFTQA